MPGVGRQPCCARGREPVEVLPSGSPVKAQRPEVVGAGGSPLAAGEGGQGGVISQHGAEGASPPAQPQSNSLGKHASKQRLTALAASVHAARSSPCSSLPAQLGRSPWPAGPRMPVKGGRSRGEGNTSGRWSHASQASASRTHRSLLQHAARAPAPSSPQPRAWIICSTAAVAIWMQVRVSSEAGKSRGARGPPGR